MPLILRHYQTVMIDEIRQHVRSGARSILATAPTGSGKTCLTAHLMASSIAKQKRAWFTVHRQELIRQSIDTLEESAGLDVGVIASGWAGNGYHRAQVASIQTLVRRLDKYEAPDLLVVDEVHHANSKTWATVLRTLRQKNPSLVTIGLTATPIRLDGRGLGEHFEVMVRGPSTARLISEKYLSPYRLFAPSMADLTGVHTVAGEYNHRELDAAMTGSKVTGDAITEYRAKCDGKRALMFLWSVESSRLMAESLNVAGIPAQHIDGVTDNATRSKAVRQFRDGTIKVLTNVEIVTEGFDLPAIEAVFLLRPTQSLGLYLQMVGRGLRLFTGKQAALIFDHSGNVFRHGLPDDEREWSLEGEARGTKKKPIQIRQCMKCYAVMPAQARKCSECGYEWPVKYREMEREEGELVEPDPAILAARTKKDEEQAAGTLKALKKIEKDRGYKPGWAEIIYRDRVRKEMQKRIAKARQPQLGWPK